LVIDFLLGRNKRMIKETATSFDISSKKSWNSFYWMISHPTDNILTTNTKPFQYSISSVPYRFHIIKTNQCKRNFISDTKHNMLLYADNFSSHESKEENVLIGRKRKWVSFVNLVTKTKLICRGRGGRWRFQLMQHFILGTPP
jgi:hypothetical protein